MFEYLGVSERIKGARERAGLSEKEVSSRSGIPVPTYVSLERDDAKYWSGVKLGELAALAGVLNEPGLAILKKARPKGEAMGISELAEGIRRYVEKHSMSMERFSLKVGYDLGGSVPGVEAIRGWNVDELSSVCDVVGVRSDVDLCR